MALGSLFGIPSPYSNDDNRNLALAASIGLLSGQTGTQQAANAGQAVLPLMMQQQQQQKALAEQNKTLQYLEQTNPQLAAQVRAGLPIAQAWQQQLEAQKPKQAKFQVLPDGTYGWVDESARKFDIAGTAAKPDELPADVKTNKYWMTHPDEYTAYQQRQLEMQKAKDSPTSQDSFKNELETMKAYRGEDPVKTYQSTRDAYEKVRTSAQLATAQGDIGLVYGFMKMLDPTSVVREGEFATAQNSGGISDTVYNIYNKALSGQRLTPEQRQKFVEASQAQYENTVKNLEGVNQRYQGLTDAYHIPSERVFEKPKTYEPLTIGGPEVNITDPSGALIGTIRKTK